MNFCDKNFDDNSSIHLFNNQGEGQSKGNPEQSISKNSKVSVSSKKSKDSKLKALDPNVSLNISDNNKLIIDNKKLIEDEN